MIFALDYSSGDPCVPFMFAKHQSSYFETLRMDGPLIKSIIHDWFLMNRIQR